jgi:hypothetical protein
MMHLSPTTQGCIVRRREKFFATASYYSCRGEDGERRAV